MCEVDEVVTSMGEDVVLGEDWVAATAATRDERSFKLDKSSLDAGVLSEVVGLEASVLGVFLVLPDGLGEGVLRGLALFTPDVR